MKNHGKLWLLIAASTLLFFSHPGRASCSFDPWSGFISSVQHFTMPLTGTISVPPDTPVGKVIYQQNISLAGQKGFYVNCTSAGQYFWGYGYQSTPLLPSNYSSIVYQTGVPGIGVKFVRTDDAKNFPLTTAIPACGMGTNCGYNTGDSWDSNSKLVLIKTDNAISSGTVKGSDLPTALYSFGQSDSMLSVYEISLSGSLQITSPTCNISPTSQSMTVSMGKYDIAVFTSKGAATEWKNASIQLANCGRFYGNSEGSNDSGNYNGTIVTYNILKNNFLSVTITPLNGIEDATKGIMKIDDHPFKASGIGIQLSTSENTTGLLNLASAIIQSLPQDGTQSITVPLYARYIQTENNAIAGKANGRLEYTITYQ